MEIELILPMNFKMADKKILSKSPLLRQFKYCYHPHKKVEKKIMGIRLDLNKSCIQTTIKKKYNQLISNYFKLNSTENTEIIESEISLLKEALENLDFAWLRATYPELRGGGTDEINIATGIDNNITISINGRVIHATHQN